MNLHPYMVEAIYLREHPEDQITKDNGTIFWYCPADNKYYWTNPNNKSRNGVYEARGLRDWWNSYLNLLDNEKFNDDEELPY